MYPRDLYSKLIFNLNICSVITNDFKWFEWNEATDAPRVYRLVPHHLCLTVINYHTTSAASNLICIPTQPTSLTWFRFCFLASEVLFLAYLVNTLFSL